MKKQITLNWSYSETEMSIDAYLKQMTEDGFYYLHSIVPISYAVTLGGAYGPSQYVNICKAILVLNRFEDATNVSNQS